MQDTNVIDPQSRDHESRQSPHSMDGTTLAHSDDTHSAVVEGGRDDELSFWQHMIAGSVAGEALRSTLGREGKRWSFLKL